MKGELEDPPPACATLYQLSPLRKNEFFFFSVKKGESGGFSHSSFDYKLKIEHGLYPYPSIPIYYFIHLKLLDLFK